jgi:hypothetical protein
MTTVRVGGRGVLDVAGFGVFDLVGFFDIIFLLESK